MNKQKYFLAIVLPDPVLQEVEALKQELFNRYGLRGALRCPAHITLHRPFEWNHEKEHHLIQKLNTFKVQSPFTLELNDFSFFEPRVIFIKVVPNQFLNNLHAQLCVFAKQELILFNEAEDLRGFHPHVTIAFRDLKKPLFARLQPLYSQRAFCAHFIVEKISLLKLNKNWEVIRDFYL